MTKKEKVLKYFQKFVNDEITITQIASKTGFRNDFIFECLLGNYPNKKEPLFGEKNIKSPHKCPKIEIKKTIEVNPKEIIDLGKKVQLIYESQLNKNDEKKT